MEEEGSIDLSVIVPSYNEEERRECKMINMLIVFICLAVRLNDAIINNLSSCLEGRKLKKKVCKLGIYASVNSSCAHPPPGPTPGH